MAKSAKELKREMNEEYSARFKRRSKQRRKTEQTRRVEVRERRWLERYNALSRRAGTSGIEIVERAPRPARGRGRRR